MKTEEKRDARDHSFDGRVIWFLQALPTGLLSFHSKRQRLRLLHLVRFAVGGERRGLYPPILAAVLLRLRGDAGRSHEAPLSPPLSTAGSPVFQASAAPGENFIPRPQSRRVPPPLGGTCPNEERWKEARRRPVKQAIKLCSLDPLSYRVRSFGIRLKDKANFLHHTTISSIHNDRS